jgi:hypothetical protein
MAGFGKKAGGTKKEEVIKEDIDKSFKEPKPEKKKDRKRPSDYRDMYEYKSKNIWKHAGDKEEDGITIKGRHFDFFKPLPNKNKYPENSYKEIGYNEYLKLTAPNFTVNIGCRKLMEDLKHRMLTGSGKLRKNMLNLSETELYEYVCLLEWAKESLKSGLANVNISYRESMLLQDINKRSK